MFYIRRYYSGMNGSVGKKKGMLLSAAGQHSGAFKNLSKAGLKAVN